MIRRGLSPTYPSSSLVRAYALIHRSPALREGITYNLTVEGGLSRGKNDRIVVL